jgi:hypothetical protein
MAETGSAWERLGASLPVDPASLFPEGDGFFARRSKARRAGLLAGIADVLARALAPGETLRWAARGYRYAAGEFYFAGWAAYHHNQTALVLTDRRLLLVQVGSRGKAADIKNQVPLAAIRGARGRSLGGFGIALADGTRLAFIGLPRADRRRLEALLPRSEGPRSATPSLEHLCPACLRPVPGRVGTTPQCPDPACRIPFRDPRRAARLSALVPGLGDLYLRHHVFGALEFLGSMLFLGLAAGMAALAFADPTNEKVLLAAILGFFAIVGPRVVDYFLTLHMGRKGLVPLALAPAPGAQARNLPSFPRWSPLLFVAGLAIPAGLVALLAQDVRIDARVRQAADLAAAGRFDEAVAVHDALRAEGSMDEARRVRLALALRKSGDLLGSDQLRAEFEGEPIDESVAREWNALVAREEEAARRFGEGVRALIEGEEAEAWPDIDAALVYFAGVKRPHLPRTRGEVLVHLAGDLLAEPLEPGQAEAAVRLAEGARDAPPAELAAVRAAAQAAAAGGTTAALDRVDASELPARFRLLLLEARARLASGEGQRRAVAGAAEALPLDELDEEDRARVRALTSAR